VSAESGWEQSSSNSSPCPVASAGAAGAAGSSKPVKSKSSPGRLHFRPLADRFVARRWIRQPRFEWRRVDRIGAAGVGGHRHGDFGNGRAEGKGAVKGPREPERGQHGVNLGGGFYDGAGPEQPGAERAFQRVRAPNALDQLAPAGAASARWRRECGGRRTVSGGVDGGGGTEAAALVAIPAVVAHERHAFRGDLREQGGDEVVRGKDLEVALRAPVAFGAVKHAAFDGLVGDFFEGERGAQQVFGETTAMGASPASRLKPLWRQSSRNSSQPQGRAR